MCFIIGFGGHLSERQDTPAWAWRPLKPTRRQDANEMIDLRRTLRFLVSTLLTVYVMLFVGYLELVICVYRTGDIYRFMLF
jgi:hypothetical protein